MLEFSEEPRDVLILDENRNPLTAGDTEKRFFEASWLHKYNGKYYFSYSTGDTHLLCYATGDNPYGPFVYQGVILLRLSVGLLIMQLPNSKGSGIYFTMTVYHLEGKHGCVALRW